MEKPNCSVVETTSQNPPVGTRDNGEQNISMGREGCVICPRQTETAGLWGRDYTMGEEPDEQQSEKLSVITTDSGVIVGLSVRHHRIVGVFKWFLYIGVTLTGLCFI